MESTLFINISKTFITYIFKKCENEMSIPGIDPGFFAPTSIALPIAPPRGYCFFTDFNLHRLVYTDPNSFETKFDNLE